MESREEWLDRKRAELRQREAELDREEAERKAADNDPAAAVVDRREGSRLPGVLILIGLFTASVTLLGLGATCFRLAGRDFDDAIRLGQAQVNTCEPQGPVGERGFGNWYECRTTIFWDDGTRDRYTAEAVFTSADIGRQIRVGDVGTPRHQIDLVRQDVPYRPWLRWIGYLIAIIFIPIGAIDALIILSFLGIRPW